MKYLLLLLVSAGLAAAEPLTAGRIDELRGLIRGNFFVPDPLPPLAAKTQRRFAPAPGVVAEGVTYSTEFGTRVPAILYLPDPLPKGGKIPAFIVVNGHGGDKYAWYSYYTGIAFARGGAAVLTYDQAGEGERSATRKSGTREHDRAFGDEVMARRLCGLMLTDVMQAVSYLASRPEVDPSRIGAGGYSLGSFVVALAGAVETRLRVCVLSGGGNLDGPGGYWDGSSKKMCQAWPYQSLAFLGDRPAVIYALQAARGPTLAWNGRADTVVNMPKTLEPFFEDLRARATALRGTAENALEFGFTDGGSHRPYFLTKPAVVWLERQLHFPNWTEGSVEAVPVTHISEWAKRTGVMVDKLYATEEREGGAMAIGDNVPGIARESLSVLTPEEWQAAKRDLMFDTWIARAREAAGK